MWVVVVVERGEALLLDDVEAALAVAGIVAVVGVKSSELEEVSECGMIDR